MSLPQAVSINDAKDALGVSVSTIYRMFDRGELTPRKIGHRTMVSLKEIRTLVEGEEPA